jgi:hypothetical protein
MCVLIGRGQQKGTCPELWHSLLVESETVYSGGCNMTEPGCLIKYSGLVCFCQENGERHDKKFSFYSVIENNYLFVLYLWFHEEHGN